MKKITSLLMILSSVFALAQVPCVDGMASGRPCDNYDLQSFFTSGQMGATRANDSWGWTDPQDGTEYALVGLNNGTAFIDISDPANPIYLGKLPTHSTSSTWRDVKVYSDHAFIVSEAGGHGMQVFDLTRLRNVTSPPETFTEDAHYNGFGSAHNIVINEDTGYAYPVGTSLFNGGPNFINIQDPLNPVFEGGYSQDDYSHDAQVITYNGPDTEHVGKEILFGSNENEVVIVDITSKTNPIALGSTSYTQVGYTHQGWFTEDQRYFIVGDELDESDFGFNTRTLVFDLIDLDNPVLSFEHFGETPAIDHNGYVVGDTYYMANYTAGLRVLDISNIGSGSISEIGYFDTYPQNNNAGFGGTWNVYPFFESGNIVITGTEGFHLAIESGNLGVDDQLAANFSMYPNPTKTTVTINSKNEAITQVDIFNVLGQRIYSDNSSNNTSITIDVSSLNSGMYMVQINGNTTKRLVVN